METDRFAAHVRVYKILCLSFFLINCNSKCFEINPKSWTLSFVLNISRYTCISTQCKVMIICGIIRRSTCHCAGLPSWITSRIPYWGALPGTSVGLGKTWVEKWVLFPELIRDNPRINLLNIIFLTIFFSLKCHNISISIRRLHCPKFGSMISF